MTQEALARLIRIMGTFDLATGHADTFDELLDSLESELRDVLGHYREALAQRTWVGLTDEDICMFSMWLDDKSDVAVFTAIEAKLKEMNT